MLPALQPVRAITAVRREDPQLVVHAFEPVPSLYEGLTGGPENYVVHPLAATLDIHRDPVLILAAPTLWISAPPQLGVRQRVISARYTQMGRASDGPRDELSPERVGRRRRSGVRSIRRATSVDGR